MIRNWTDEKNNVEFVYSDKFWFYTKEDIENGEEIDMSLFPEGTHFFYDSGLVEEHIKTLDRKSESFEKAFRDATKNLKAVLKEKFDGRRVLDIQYSPTLYWRGAYIQAKAVLEKISAVREDVEISGGYGIDGDSFTKMEAIKQVERKLVEEFSDDEGGKCFVDDIKTFNDFSRDIKDTRWYARGEGRGFYSVDFAQAPVRTTWGVDQEDERAFHREGEEYGYRETLFSEREAIRDAKAHLLELHPDVGVKVAYGVHDGSHAFAGFYGVAIGYIRKRKV